ncbi:hypothetical protein [Saccharothrix obliqua]|uniref:hypothetical protein n=1 Tax=Saccharothrix obliqua TaxID=2861747 RepID=UPI001C5F97E8|nr:hypothetical protein [Saccharothrix obliqua]MBW4722353.1 hypothetical protein [Saccharothrix obliqua]
MGVLTDYFRAADAADVVRVVEQDLHPLDGWQPGFDGVSAKQIDPVVVLGILVAAVRDVPWEPGVVGQRAVWPTTPKPERGVYVEDDPWLEGPWVFELDTATRDVLADVPDAALPGLGERWSRSEEVMWSGPELAELAGELSALARRAREAGELLYCWTCL